MMDIVEFVEKFTDVKLFDWQKEYLRKFQDLKTNGKLHVRWFKGNFYMYPDKQILKELIPNGKTIDSK